MEKEKLIIKTEYDKQIEELEKEKDELYNKHCKPLNDRISKLEEERIQHLIKTNTYGKFPLSKEYEGKDISHIKFVTSDGEIDYVCGEIVDIRNGYPHISDYYNGNIDYDMEDNCFYHWYYGNKTKLNYIGYLEIEFED